ncbi:ABC transporter permease [Herbivorax sp. ANBcel31]|uniref:ABC transporter permease n=1 Tax=Herbivorax sp. ANBcel31 TaxID=3069754 RepID=UPI0027AEB11E|nr:ABC transporter permease [Herbivorax sp. ANBcel31]MDQ2087987.1 ABC transporter permease [Herbivorax sp. ANBcel31]
MDIHIKQYFLLLKWQLLRLRLVIPLFAVIQIMTGVGFILGLGFMVPDIDTETALFFVTGGPTLVLVMVGLVMVPQMITEDKASGNLTYIWSLPISRITYLLSDLTMWIFSTLPGVVLALMVGSWYYNFHLSISWMILPSMLLVSATASCLGYAIAHFISKPQIVSMITNLIVFILFLFSPINYPLENLPNWMQSVHTVLPVTHMADLIRSSLTSYEIESLPTALIIVSGWMMVSFVAVAVVLQKRK